jgi:phage gp45-like
MEILLSSARVTYKVHMFGRPSVYLLGSSPVLVPFGGRTGSLVVVISLEKIAN